MGCSRPGCPWKIDRGCQAAVCVVRIRFVSTSVVFSCFNQQNILLPKEKKKLNQGTFRDALTYQEGQAEVLFHTRSLNWREKDGEAIQVKQAMIGQEF